MPMLPPDYQRPSTSKYVKLEAGENQLRILAAPIFGYVGWTGEKGKDRKPVRRKSRDEFGPEVPDDKENRIKFFWAMPVWDYRAKQVKVWELTQVSVMDAITALDNNAKWGDARDFDLCVIREGDGLDTEYTTMPEPKTELPAEANEAWEAVRAAGFDLNVLYTNGDPFDPDASQIPF